MSTHPHTPQYCLGESRRSPETLVSYLTRIAAGNHLTISDILAVLPAWFTTKTNNPDERTQHHMLAPASTDALHALARLSCPASSTWLKILRLRVGFL